MPNFPYLKERRVLTRRDGETASHLPSHSQHTPPLPLPLNERGAGMPNFPYPKERRVLTRRDGEAASQQRRVLTRRDGEAAFNSPPI